MNVSSLRQAVKARKVLEMFEYNCSHTLCSPLKSIQGLLNLLEQETDQAQITAYLDMIIKATTKLEVIIKELNQAVMGAEGELVVSSINFTDIIQNVLSDFAQRITGKSIIVSLSIDQARNFYSDAARLNAIFTHLICNAIAFSGDKPEKKIDIHVSVHMNECIITVADNGCGIPAEMREKIFQPFFRGSEKSTGPGLGLFIVTETIRSMRAMLDFDSQVGKGSTFRLILPSHN